MQKTNWSERSLVVGLPVGMFPFYIERLEGTTSRIHAKLKGISAEVLAKNLDNKWSVKQNLAHLAELNEIALLRINEITSGISPMTPANVELKQDYNTMPVESICTYFEETRRKAIDKFNSLTDDELKKIAVHPRFKVAMTPVDLAWFYAEHDDHHLVRVNEILATLYKK